MRLSTRTDWSHEPTALSHAIALARDRGRVLDDLTIGNPTRCGLGDRRDDVRALGEPAGAIYAPDPWGLPEARDAIVAYYRERGRAIDARDVLLTASTSEAYAWLFKLLCDPGDTVLAPRPSYPLFPYIAELEGVRLGAYPLVRQERWRVDVGALERALDETEARAILAVHPGNPTGTFIHPDDAEVLLGIAHERDLALIVDEVFLDYAIGGAADWGTSFAGEPNTFVLSGLSKVALLPQVKLGWMVLGAGHGGAVRSRLEVIADTYLSVSAAVQHAAPQLLQSSAATRHALRARIADNGAILDAVLARHPELRRIPSDGGWYACVEIPRTKSDDAWCEELIREESVIVHPGHFFDMEERGVMVVSLLPEAFEAPFCRAARCWAAG